MSKLIEMATTGEHSLKLFWGDGKNYRSEDLATPRDAEARILELMDEDLDLAAEDLDRLERMIEAYDLAVHRAKVKAQQAAKARRRQDEELSDEFLRDMGGLLQDLVTLNQAAMDPTTNLDKLSWRNRRGF